MMPPFGPPEDLKEIFWHRKTLAFAQRYFSHVCMLDYRSQRWCERDARTGRQNLGQGRMLACCCLLPPLSSASRHASTFSHSLFLSLISHIPFFFSFFFQTFFLFSKRPFLGTKIECASTTCPKSLIFLMFNIFSLLFINDIWKL